MTHTKTNFFKHFQQGVALTEFIILCFALIPLILLIPVIAKIQDISHYAQLASRYVTFETMYYNDSVNQFKSETIISEEVRRRFFSNIDAPIKSGDVAGNFKAHQNLFWRGPDSQSLLKPFEDITVSYGQNYNDTHSEGFSNINNESISFGGSTVTNRMYLNTRGIYRANVNVPIFNLPNNISNYEPFNNINLNIKRHTSIMFNHWAANSPEETQLRFGQLAPLNSVLSNIEPILNLGFNLVEFPEVKSPQFGRLDLWSDIIQTDRVP